MQKSSAKVMLVLAGNNVKATIRMDATDIGAGSCTIVAQTASEYLKIPVADIKVELGDSDFPVTPGSGGSWGAASYSNGAMAACKNAIATLKENRNIKDEEEVPLADLMKTNQLETFEAEGTSEPLETAKKYSIFSFGANFSEVWVNKDMGMFRLNVATARINQMALITDLSGTFNAYV